MQTWLEAALSFVYPPVCQICGTGRVENGDGYLCRSCWSRPGGPRFLQPPFCLRCGLPSEGAITTPYECGNCAEMTLHFRQARAAVLATEIVLEIIHRYKYQKALWFEPFLSQVLARKAAEELRAREWDGLIPVPLHPVKERERGFNQAARLAAGLSRATGLPLHGKVMRRVRFTPSQTTLSRSDRNANMRRAFEVRAEGQLPGKRFVLIDDVLTTGATCSACALALRKAGAKDVCVWTVARGR